MEKNQGPASEPAVNSGEARKTHPAVVAAAWAILVIATFWVLAAGRTFIIPLVLAFLIAYLIETLRKVCDRAFLKARGKWFPAKKPERSEGDDEKSEKKSGFKPPSISTILSALVICTMIWGFYQLLSSNVSELTAAAPRYQARLMQLYEETLTFFHVEQNEVRELPDRIMKMVNLRAVAGGIGSGMGNLIGNGALIFIYLFFILLERRFLWKKILAAFPGHDRRDSMQRVWKDIDKGVRKYLGVKTFVSLLTAGGGYVIMRLVGLDFAEFWAVLLFIFNWIPNIGSLVATALPTLLALVQFDTFREAAIVGIGVMAVQLIVANLVEPRMMGKSLDMSTLVVILSLVFWGMIWGIVGMFLCVPLTAVIMIVLSNFDSTKWVSTLLSSGEFLDKNEDGVAA